MTVRTFEADGFGSRDELVCALASNNSRGLTANRCRHVLHSTNQKNVTDQARPANSRVSVDTFTFSPSLMKRGTRISIPVSSLAGLVTLPLAVSPRAPGSV